MRASPGEIDACYAAIENTVGAIANQRVVPVTLDGDEAIALPEMRALQKLSSGIVVVDLREQPIAALGRGQLHVREQPESDHH